MLWVCEHFWRSGICIQEMYAVRNQCEVKGGKHPYIHLLFYFRLMASMVVQHRCLCSSLKGHCGCWGAGTPCQCQRWGHELGFLLRVEVRELKQRKEKLQAELGKQNSQQIEVFLVRMSAAKQRHVWLLDNLFAPADFRS